MRCVIAISLMPTPGGRPLRQQESCIAHTTEAKNTAVEDGPWSGVCAQRSHRGKPAQTVHPSLTSCIGAGQQ
jgi:hypothetical protein